MKKSILKSALLFAAMTAFAVPASASAAGWGPVLSTGHLVSTNTQVSVPGIPAGFTCSNIDYGYKARNPASYTLDITSASFTGCSGLGNWTNCGVSWTTTGLPWAITGGPVHPTVGVNLTGTVTGTPGVCAAAGEPITLTGALYTTWTAATHSLTYSGGTGWTLTEGGILPRAATATGTLRNTSQTLTLT